VDQHPAAVAVPESEADVVAAVNFAREAGLRVAPQATGHNAGPLAPALADALRVLRRWAAWAPDAPDDVTTSARIMQFPQLPSIPEPLRGRNVVMIDGVVLGGESRAQELLRPMRQLRPELDTFATIPAAELRQLGGALERRPDRHGALPALDAGFALVAVAIAPDAETALAGAAATRRVSGELEPWVSERTYLGFTSKPIDARTAFEPAAYRRLQRIKGEVDPDGLFRANHAIDPAAGGETTKG
jgi:FAD/FMN-containing dehydrogenase